MKQPSIKSTKNEILEAYEELLQEVEKSKTPSLQKNINKPEKEAVNQAGSRDSKEIIHNIAELKLQTSNALENLAKKLIAEREKLNNLQESVRQQEIYLQDLHEITANANSLETLILCQKRKREEFENWMESTREKFNIEMSEKKLVWDKQKKDYELEQNEKRESKKKEWQRLEEEYNYQTQLTRQKNEDEYLQKQLVQERELGEKRKTFELECEKRESSLLEQEQEIAELRSYKNSAENEIQKAVQDERNRVTENLEKKYELESSVKDKEKDSEIALLKQNIKFLQEKISDQDKSIELLNKRLAESQTSSQELAKKIIEGNSQIFETKRLIVQDSLRNSKLQDTDK